MGLADAVGVSEGLMLLPFEWSEVSLVATGARELRVRATVERRGDGEAWRCCRWPMVTGGRWRGWAGCG